MTLTKESKIKVLHLARWYPNRYDPMPGLFIQRHAEASSIYCDAGVVYTHSESNEDDKKPTYDIDFYIINNVPTAKVYYKTSGCKINPIKKIINSIRFFKANQLGITKVKQNTGGFDLIHIHILTRLGIIGLYYKLLHKKPYIITEHWSRYLDLTGSFVGFFRKLITKFVVKEASCVTAVTDNLASAMKKHSLNNKNYVILPNVVDNVFLSNDIIDESNNDIVNFLHVSCFEDKSKNISGLLRVISQLSKNRNDFIFTLVGDGMDMPWLKKYSQELGLTEEIIKYTGLLEGEDLANEMKSADMLVIFSNYENFPVVMNESLSLGVPVIATRVGGIPERVNSRNGILVDAGNEAQLLQAFTNFLDKEISFDMIEIQKEAINEFSPSTIGSILYNLYKEAIA